MSLVDVGPVLAAGAVCWREGRAGIEVLLIFRPRHKDVSLPKGKVDEHETLPVAAVREIREETGYSVTLGPPLGSSEYILPGGRDKVVRYWAAEVRRGQLRRGRFRPNDEVDQIEWVPLGKARKRLTYPRDADVLDRFVELVHRHHHRTFPVIALRHAKAEQDNGEGDAARPLSSRGKHQAEVIVPALRAFEVRAILTSPAKRCVDTVKPLAKLLDLPIKRTPILGQDVWEAGDDQGRREQLDRVLGKRMAKRTPTVVCSHSPVLPEILDAVVRRAHGERDGRLVRAAILTTAEFTVLHLSANDPESGLVAMESHAPLV